MKAKTTKAGTGALIGRHIGKWENKKEKYICCDSILKWHPFSIHHLLLDSF